MTRLESSPCGRAAIAIPTRPLGNSKIFVGVFAGIETPPPWSNYPHESIGVSNFFLSMALPTVPNREPVAQWSAIWGPIGAREEGKDTGVMLLEMDIHVPVKTQEPDTAVPARQRSINLAPPLPLVDAQHPMIVNVPFWFPEPVSLTRQSFYSRFESRGRSSPCDSGTVIRCNFDFGPPW